MRFAKCAQSISAILSSVRRALIFAGLLSLAFACLPVQFRKAAAQAQQPQTEKQPPPQNPAQQPPAPPPQPAPTLHTVVIDPGHGGADTGARGPTGLAEKDIVLELAQAVASSLRAQGFEVVMTRVGDTDPSLDDRAAIANAQSNAVFISLHVGSTGAVGTVRTYTYLFPTAPQLALASVPGASPNAVTSAGLPQAAAAPTPPPGFLLWSEAQEPFVAQSVKLGDLVQVELAQKFKGSPEISSSVPVAVLRSVAAPAVAVEVSSVAADQQKLEAMSGDLAASISRAVAGYKTIYPPGGK
jgi:N-acetylmuramoyl-L-alanine amidase